MARIKQGFLGNASGKLGTVVFAKWRDLQTARQYQPDIHDANSSAQQKQRSRMVSLLQFLKPLNKNFIQFFNSSIAKGSTPWAVAIKSNMPFVSPEGIINLQDLVLGDPNCPASKIVEVTYNPFIDSIHLKYELSANSTNNDPNPYIGVSVLGKYYSPAGTHEFNLNHLLCFLPPGHFWCSIFEGYLEHVYDNHLSSGYIWMDFYQTYNWDKHINPNVNLTEPSFFVPKPTVEGFNLNVENNLIPLEAITHSYTKIGVKWFLKFNIDLAKTHVVLPANHTIILWTASLLNGKVVESGPIEWNLAHSSFKIDLGTDPYKGSFAILYAVFNNEGEQVGKFNRFYIATDSDGNDHPYFEQIFKCDYAHPASFILSGNNCGFVGNIDELFGEFIELWNQGYIHDGSSTASDTEFPLYIKPEPNITVLVTGFTRMDGVYYIFDKNAQADIQTTIDHGFKLNAWEGPDGSEVKTLGLDTYQIQMSKERNLIPVIVPV